MGELIKIFDYQAKTVRTIVKDGQPWFVAKDVCEVLELSNHKDAISRLAESMKSVVGIADPHGRTQDTTVISEAGVYKLVFTSRKPEAEKFTDWIAQEVLPQIRQTGSYSIEPKSDEEIILLGYEKLLGKVKLLECQVIELEPKAEFFDTVRGATGYHTIGEAAKLLGTGRTRLFDYLKAKDILCNDNTPRQGYKDSGYFDVIETPFKSGQVDVINTQTVVTGKGLTWLQKSGSNLLVVGILHNRLGRQPNKIFHDATL
jgi:anti-repressor protein